MSFLRDLSIRGKLIGIILLVTLFALTTGFVIFFLVLTNSLKKDLLSSMTNTTKIVADYCITPLEFGDKERAIDILEKLSKEPQIVCVQILDERNEYFAFFSTTCDLPSQFTGNYQGGAFYEGEFLHVLQPVIFQNKVYGRVYLRASTATVQNNINRLLLYIIFTIAAVTIVAVVLATLLQRIISQPLKKLTELTKTVSQKNDYSLRADHNRNDEIGILYDGFNHMLHQIQERQDQELRSKKALEISEAKFRNIYQNSMVGIFQCDFQQGHIFEANQRFWEILSLPAQKTLPLPEVLSLKDLARLRMMLAEGDIIENYEVVLQNNQDEKIWLSLSGRLFRDANFFEGVIKEITNEKESFLELKKVNFELDNFVYHTSHDLRSPLLSILGLINICKNETSLESVMTYFDLIERSIKRLDALVINLLTLSRNSRVDDKTQLIDLKRLVNEAVEILNLNKPQNLTIEVEVKQTYEFISDPTRINIILNNLISNAIKYQNPSEEAPFVKIKATVDQHEAFIEIQDNGMGIRPESHAKIFTMFYRATDQGQGSGLGLYIVKNVLDKLKGQISFTSAIRRGTTFSIRIPNLI
jgi:signal transduction histidine kinase